MLRAQDLAWGFGRGKLCRLDDRIRRIPSEMLAKL